MAIPSEPLSPNAADRCLRQFICQGPELQLTEPQRADIRQALHILVAQADFLTLGVCADTVEAALTGLQGYLNALGQSVSSPEPELLDLHGPVYLKANTRTQGLYGDRYTGPYRGILVACQSDYADVITGTYGHFPLDLFSTD